MTNTSDFASSYQRYESRQRQVNASNRTLLFDALERFGITSVTAEFDGEGDSGQIGQITAFTGEAKVSLPDTSLQLREASFGSEDITQSQFPLPSAIETLCYGYLEQQHGGWENNEGAFGEFYLDVKARTIKLEFNARFVDTFLSTHSL